MSPGMFEILNKDGGGGGGGGGVGPMRSIGQQRAFLQAPCTQSVVKTSVRVFSRISRKEGFDRTERGFFLSHALRFLS